jgi:hypothetical protein
MRAQQNSLPCKIGSLARSPIQALNVRVASGSSDSQWGDGRTSRRRCPAAQPPVRCDHLGLPARLKAAIGGPHCCRIAAVKRGAWRRIDADPGFAGPNAKKKSSSSLQPAVAYGREQLGELGEPHFPASLPTARRAHPPVAKAKRPYPEPAPRERRHFPQAVCHRPGRDRGTIHAPLGSPWPASANLRPG